MSLINPSNLYSEGNVSLDSSPYTKIVLQQRARKQAQDDAMDKYYGNLPNTINEQGVRDQEIPLIHQKKNEIQQYFMENKDKIRKGNTPEAYNYWKMFRDAQGIVTESKNRTNTAAKIAQLRGNPKYDYIFRDKGILARVHAHDLPVGTEGSSAIDFNQLTLPPVPFDPNKYIQNFKDIKPSEAIEVVPNPNDKYTQIQRTKPVLDDAAKLTIAQRAADNLVDNPSFETHIKGKMEKDPNLLPQIQKAFKDAYGRDINPMLADHDIAVGYTLLTLPNMGAKEKLIPNESAKAKDRQDAATLAYNRRIGLAKLNDALIRGRKEDGTVDINQVGYPTNELFKQYGKTVNSTFEGMPAGSIDVIYDEDIPVEAMREYNPQDYNKGVIPVQALVESGTKRKYWKVEKDANGNINLLGKDNRKIGADDARNNFIKENVGTNFKLKVNLNKPGVNKGQEKPVKEVPTLNASEYKKKKKG